MADSIAEPEVLARESRPQQGASSDEKKTTKRTRSQGDAIVDQALQVITKVRQLDALARVEGRLVGREELRSFVKRQLKNEIPSQTLFANEVMLYGLHTVGPQFDYEAALTLLLGQQLAGYYDPQEKTMFLADDLGEAEQQATLLHELVHALQDQHYDIGRLVQWEEGKSDRVAAVHALAEGDATSAMIDAMLVSQHRRAIDLPDAAVAGQVRGAMELSLELAEVPGVIKRSLVAPYADGMIFVHWLRRRKGWSLVDDAWRRLPTSTEQVLHPEKWLKREQPVQVPMPRPPKTGPQEAIYRDVLGEQTLRIVFQEWMPNTAAEAAAADWGGDQVAVFSKDNRYALAWHLRFDNELAAERALVAFARGILYGAEHPIPGPKSIELAPGAAAARAEIKNDRLCRERPAQGPYAALRGGADLAVVAGPFEDWGIAPRSSGGCTEALTWAREIVAQGSSGLSP